MRYLYILAVYLAAPLISLVMLWRGFGDRSYWSSFGERFGFGERLPPGSVWIHAVSVGEVQASAALVTTLRERYPGIPVVVTTLTPTGATRAKTLFKDLAQVRYIPFDLPGSVRRFFLNFPDPWWKSRQHKRRVVSAGLIADMVQALAPGGEIFVQTDIFAIALEAMAALEGEAAGRLRNAAGPWSFYRDNPFAACSRRERQCQTEGTTIWRLLFGADGAAGA